MNKTLVKELSVSEMQSIDGGLLSWLIGTFISGLAYDIISNWDETCKSARAGYRAGHQ